MTAPVPAPRDLNEVFFGGGTPADHSELTALGLPAALSTVDVLNAAAGSRNATLVPQAQTQGAGPATVVQWSVTSPNTNPGKWHLQFAGSVFNTTPDSVMQLGYNVEPGGDRELAGEPALYLQWESDYNDGVRHNVEFHLDYVSAAGAATAHKRPIMIQINRQTDAMTQFELRATSLAFTDWATGTQFASIGLGAFSMLAVSGTNNSIGINAAVGQASSLLMQHNATAAFSISTNSATNVGVAVGGTTILTLFGGGSTRRMNLGPTGDNTHIFTAESDNGNTAINARGFSSQVGDIFRVENSGLTQLFGITPAGLPRFPVAGNAQTTVGAAGGATALPATPTKYFKVVDSAGTTLVIPAYAAS